MRSVPLAWERPLEKSGTLHVLLALLAATLVLAVLFVVLQPLGLGFATYASIGASTLSLPHAGRLARSLVG